MKAQVNNLATLFLLLLGAAYAILFYHAEMGINLLLFDGLLLLTALKCRPELARNRGFIWSVGGLLFAAGAVVIVHGPEAVVAHHLTYLIVLGFAQARELRFIWYSFLLGVISLFRGPLQARRRRKAEKLAEDDAQVQTVTVVGRWIRQGLVSVAILVPFVLFYLSGNQALSNGLEAIFSGLNDFRVPFNLVWVILLFLFSIALCLPLLFPRLQPSRLVGHQAGFRDELLRRRDANGTLHPRPRPEKPIYRPSSRKILGLRGHYRQAVITFTLLNALLAVVNTTDLAYVWLPAGELSAATLSHYVHVGTWNLTFSIGLAMLVVLYYFRANLNFLPDAPLLRPLARLWLAQNALLALSVAVRNYHYIDAYGLAGGRVIIGFVLLLILFGLFTLLRKIDQRLTLTWLLQTNGIAAWLLLLAFSAVNWSGVITRYNLATQPAEAVDWYYLKTRLDRRNAFLLWEHPEATLDTHRKALPATHRRTDWRSWNYADWRNYRYFAKR